MLIRQSGLDDRDTLTQLRLAFLAEYRGMSTTELPDGFAEHTRRFIERNEQAGSMSSWLALEDGCVIGMVSLLVRDVPPVPEDGRTREGLLINMYVIQSHRRRGIGRALLRTCLDQAEELGLQRLCLRSTDDGRSLYLREGFSPPASRDYLEFRPPGRQ